MFKSFFVECLYIIEDDLSNCFSKLLNLLFHLYFFDKWKIWKHAKFFKKRIYRIRNECYFRSRSLSDISWDDLSSKSSGYFRHDPIWKNKNLANTTYSIFCEEIEGMSFIFKIGLIFIIRKKFLVKIKKIAHLWPSVSYWHWYGNVLSNIFKVLNFLDRSRNLFFCSQ